MSKKYTIKLTEDELELIHKAVEACYETNKEYILLALNLDDLGPIEKMVVKSNKVGITIDTVLTLKRLTKFFETYLEAIVD
jgi:hypothetical protein